MIQNLKKTVYLPVKVEKNDLPTTEVCALNESDMLVGYLKYLGEGVIRPIVYVENEHQEMGNVTHWLKPQEGYFLTPEQLNEDRANVIRQALETAAEKVRMKDINEDGHLYEDDEGNCPEFYVVDKQSIINTFEETYQKLKI